LGRARLRARRLHVVLQTIVTHGTFVNRARVVVESNCPIWAGPNTIPASIAHVLLNEHCVEFSLDNGLCRAYFKAAGVRAMLAYVGHHQPRVSVSNRHRLVGHALNEFHVSPILIVELARVVEAVAKLRLVTSQLVPFFARNFARFAADADTRISKETEWFSHC